MTCRNKDKILICDEVHKPSLTRLECKIDDLAMLVKSLTGKVGNIERIVKPTENSAIEIAKCNTNIENFTLTKMESADDHEEEVEDDVPSTANQGR